MFGAQSLYNFVLGNWTSLFYFFGASLFLYLFFFLPLQVIITFALEYMGITNRVR